MSLVPVSPVRIAVRGLFWVLLAGGAYVGMLPSALAAKPAVQAGKERLVLMPLRVGKEDQDMQGAMETALVQGLQKRYEVFAGEDVAQKAREIFRKESRTAKKDCDETRCMEDIAIAFQSELIAAANVTRVEGGYLLALNIRNVMDNKAVLSNSLPCRGCDAFQVVDRLKELSDADAVAASGSGRINDSADGGDREQHEWQAAESAGDEASYRNYLRNYPSGHYAELAQSRLRKPQPAGEVSEDEKKLWQMAQDRHSSSAVQAYLDKYPEGRYVVPARSRLKKLREEEAAAQREPVVPADERLKEAEAASKAKGVSPIRVIPKYLEKVIPGLIQRKKDVD